ncbi:hypothetical protein KP509_03G042200 [Ceratopteris richardii]|uniref:Uncharacterized protein n=1 Tax=Ceratopteris richardii TaxID=49495 RepID=A0A8T2V709_CERRI|nr:hypothetical protein KP509_03G042200 [Ceratopteris richardii]
MGDDKTNNLVRASNTGWATAFSVLLSRAWQQRMKDQHWSLEVESLLKEFLQSIELFILPEAVEIVLFLFSWVWNFLAKTKIRVLHALTWWFHTKPFVARGLCEGAIDSLKYATSWLAILSVRFSFILLSAGEANVRDICDRPHSLPRCATLRKNGSP